MNFLLANTTNHRRAIMLVATMLLGIFMVLVFYKNPLTFREFIFPPIVGLLVFEFLFRTRQHLKLITLPLYIIIVVIIGDLMYGLLYYGWGGGWNLLSSLQFLFTEFPYNLYALIEYSIVTSLGYYLIKIYRNKSWVPSESTVGASNEPIYDNQPVPENGWLQKYKQQIAGFLGWFVIATFLSGGSVWGLITTPVTVIALIIYARSKQSKGVAGGILIAISLNFFVSLVRGLSLNAWCLIPFYNGIY